MEIWLPDMNSHICCFVIEWHAHISIKKPLQCANSMSVQGYVNWIGFFGFVWQLICRFLLGQTVLVCKNYDYFRISWNLIALFVVNCTNLLPVNQHSLHFGQAIINFRFLVVKLDKERKRDTLKALPQAFVNLLSFLGLNRQ